MAPILAALTACTRIFPEKSRNVYSEMTLSPHKAPLLQCSSNGCISPFLTLTRLDSLFVLPIRGYTIRAAILILVVGLTAVPASVARDLNDPELVYTYVSRAFPDTVEHAGGLSSEISLAELICYFSNTRKSGQVGLEARCWARAAPEGATMSARGDVKELILGLIKAGLLLNRKAEPGTTYLSAMNLECERLECKSADPAECAGTEISYECSID